VQTSATPTEPFLWPAGPLGCLLLHGFTSTPYEMRFLGERLAGAGHTVAAVRLAGHGTIPEDLERSGWRDWYRSAEAGAGDLAAHCTRIVAVGLSMGALLALQLAYDRPAQVGGLVLLSTALQLSNRWSGLSGSLGLLAPALPERMRFIAKRASDIADPEARRLQPGYRRIPLRSVAELTALQRRVRRLLPRIGQPVLAIHARQDHTAPLANLSLLRRLPNLREAIVLEQSYHVISVDREKERVADAVVRFANEIGGAPG
jgi:carboxylesterase